MEHGLEVPRGDLRENVLASGDEEFDHRPTGRGDVIEKLAPLVEEWPRAFDESTHQVTRLLEKLMVASEALPRRDLKSTLEVVDCNQLLRDVDPIALESIAADVLPVIGELQGGADGVAESEERLVPALAEEHEDEATHRIGAQSAVADELLPRLVSRDGLVEFEGPDEVVEGLDRELMAGDCRLERHEDGMNRGAGEAGFEFASPPRQQFEGPLGGTALVAEVVGASAEGVDRGEVGLEPARDQVREHAEVLVVAASETPAPRSSLGLGDRCGAVRPPAIKLVKDERNRSH